MSNAPVNCQMFKIRKERFCGKYKMYNPAKKAKLDDFSWGEDELDIEQLNDVLDRTENQMTQVKENVVATQSSFAYSRFEQRSSVFSSTQMDLPPGAPLRSQLHHWQQKYKEKEGEVSVLRTNLRKLQDTHQAEKDERMKAWQKNNQKTEQDLKTKKSELEFKNLEVANLQQQISDLKRLVGNECASLQALHNDRNKESLPLPRLTSQKQPEPEENYKIKTNSQKYYPLQCIINPILAYRYENDKQIDQMSVEPIQSVLLSVAAFSFEELESEAIIVPVNRILDFLGEHLRQFSTSIPSRCDGRALYLKLCSECLVCLSEILPFNSTLQHNILYEVTPDYVLTNQILQTVNAIKRQDKHEEYTEFFIAVFKFLSAVFNIPNIHNSHIYVDLKNMLNALLVDMKYEKPVITPITISLKSLSKNSLIVEEFCKKIPTHISYNKRQSVVESSCLFYKYAHLCETSLQTLHNPEELLDTALILLGSINNIFESNASWLYQSETRCNCLSTLYKLSVRMIHRTLKAQMKGNCVGNKIVHFVKNSITVFHLLLFNSPDYMQKYGEIYSKFRHSVFTLIQNQDQFGLDSTYVTLLSDLSPEQTEYSKSDLSNITL